MEILIGSCQEIVISDVPALDPIRVFADQPREGVGRVVITCYDSAWTGYWGAIGDRSIYKFFTDCDAEYLANNLGCAQSLNRAKHNREYLIRIIKAVQEAFEHLAVPAG